MNLLKNFANAVLVQDWKSAWRWLSMWFATVLVVWSALPFDTQSAILAMFGISQSTLTAIMGLAIMVGRLVKQDSA